MMNMLYKRLLGCIFLNGHFKEACSYHVLPRLEWRTLLHMFYRLYRLLQNEIARFLSPTHLDGRTIRALGSLLRQLNQGFFSGCLYHLLHVLNVWVRQDGCVILKALGLFVDKASLGYRKTGMHFEFVEFKFDLIYSKKNETQYCSILFDIHTDLICFEPAFLHICRHSLNLQSSNKKFTSFGSNCHAVVPMHIPVEHHMAKIFPLFGQTKTARST